MSQRSGNPVSIYSLSGQGIVWLAPMGTAAVDVLDDGQQIYVVSWTGQLAVAEQDVTDTRDYNPVDRVMNPRSLNVSRRLTGKMEMFHDSDPDKDFLLLYPTTLYPAARLYLTEGNTAVVGPPAIAASRSCYFDLAEIHFMNIDLGGGAVGDFRKLGPDFQSNGIFTYSNVDAA